MDASYTHPRDATATPLALQSVAIPGIGSTFGALLLSTFFSLMLYGLLAHQTFRYFRMYSGDIPFLKTLVFAIFAVDTLHSATLMHLCYHYFVIDYFNPLGLVVGIWSVQTLPLTTGIIIILTQSFYARRIYLVDRHYLPIVLLVVILMVIEFGFVMASSVECLKDNTFEGLGSRVWMITAIFAVAASIDLTLTGTLVFILRKSYTGFERTNTVLHTLSLYAVIATGLNTTLTVPAFICSLAQPHNFIYFAIAIPVTKAYSNSVLAMLNCRQGLKGHLAGSSNDTPPMAAFLSHGTDPSGLPGASVPQSQNERVPRPPPSSYAMVRIKMPRTTGGEDARPGEAMESLEAKIGEPERWDI